MGVTVYSFAMSVLFSSLFIVVIHLLRNRPFFFHTFGVHTILCLYALCLIRTIVVLEFPFTIPVGLHNTYSTVYEFIMTAHLSIGESEIHLLPALCGIWALVSVTLIVQFLWKNWKVASKAEWYSTNKDPYAEQVLGRVKEESWRTPAVSVYICPTLDIPMGTGLFRHQICLPEQKYTKEEMYYILKHEYTHFCNRDLTVKFLVHLFCCIFWWNPVVYLFKKDVSQILEIHCDIKATENFGKKEKLEYLFTIVQVLERTDAAGERPPDILATGLACRKNGDDVRERFRVITANSPRNSRLCQGVLWTLAIAFIAFSYSFVLQSAFEPPMEDIYTDETVYEFTVEDGYILKKEDGSFYLVLRDGTIIPISNNSSLEVYLADGLQIREE